MPSSSSVSLSSSRFKATNRGAWKLIGRKEFENVNKQLCIKKAIKWVDA